MTRKNEFRELVKTTKKDFKELIETAKEFPNIKDWTATVRAMFMLYDTYEFNLTEANKGNILYQVKDELTR